jgi:AraC family transcriptional regulator
LGTSRNLRASGIDHTSDRVPEPILSSRSRRWNGIVVDLYRVRDVDFVKPVSAHIVTVFLRGPVDLLQRRNGRAVQRRMHAGDVIVAPAGEAKTLQHREEAELVKLQLEPSFFKGIANGLAAIGGRQVELLDNFGTRDAYVEGVARQLVEELRADNLAGPLYAESLATGLGVHLLRHYSTAGKLSSDPSGTLPRFKLQRVIDYIHDNLHEDLTLEKISATLSMSPFHFAHAFRETMGLAPHHYVIQCRIDRARILLCETDHSIAEIAHLVGYSNQSNFSVVFHRVAGQTPRSYRSKA